MSSIHTTQIVFQFAKKPISRLDSRTRHSIN